jgi:hypothetical protein
MIALVACSVFSRQVQAQQSLSQTDSVVGNLAASLQHQYVFADKGAELAQKLMAAHKASRYAALNNETLAAALNRDLQQWGNDKHLRVGYSAGPLPMVTEVQMEIPAEEKAGYGEYLRRDNYGINKLEVLKGNIGYIDFKYFCTPEFAGDSYAAMMNYVAQTDALIIDLRQCMGSTSPDAIPFISSYLFDKPVHLNDLYWRKGNITNQSWTYAYVPGKRYVGKPVYLLVGNGTFSGAEELAYDLKNLKRATLFGEQTGGGANGGGHITLSTHFNVFMPVGRAINPITKTNWEGVGVAPDSVINPARALYAAHKTALQTIAQAVADTGYKQYLAQVIKEITENAPRFKPVGFELAGYPDAKEVFVAGSFNGWSQKSLPMVRKGNKWVATGEAEPGKVQYKFIVDGAWMTDPANKAIAQDGGNSNSVKVVMQ